MIKEGKCKGNVKEKPKKPRPKTSPPGQKSAPIHPLYCLCHECNRDKPYRLMDEAANKW